MRALVVARMPEGVRPGERGAAQERERSDPCFPNVLAHQPGAHLLHHAGAGTCFVEKRRECRVAAAAVVQAQDPAAHREHHITEESALLIQSRISPISTPLNPKNSPDSYSP